MSKKGCKLEYPEENPRMYPKGFETYKVPSMEQGVTEKAPKDSATLPQPPGNHRALDSTGVAQSWATSSVPNARPGLLMPFGTIAVGLKNAALNQAFRSWKPNTSLLWSLRHFDHVLTCLWGSQVKSPDLRPPPVAAPPQHSTGLWVPCCPFMLQCPESLRRETPRAGCLT